LRTHLARVKTRASTDVRKRAARLKLRAVQLWKKASPVLPASAQPPAAPTLYPLDVRWGEDKIAAFPGVVTSSNLIAVLTEVEKITGVARRRAVAGEGASDLVKTLQLPQIAERSVPRLVNSLEGYNVVEYEGWYHGIPQRLGDMQLDKIDVIENPDIIRDLSREVVENEIRETVAGMACAA
jgi:hypothetical protein